MIGNGGSDKLIGGAGDDELRGGGSRIVRGDGQVLYYRDRLVPGAGDDVLVPGYDGGNHETPWDLLDFSDAPGRIVADVASDTITGHGSDVVVGDFYAVLGSRYDDTLTGGDGDDELHGYEGADQLRGGHGNDTLNDSGYFQRDNPPDDDLLVGGPGADFLKAESGKDHILGGSGNDLISSWNGFADHIHAGPGNDDISGRLVLSADQSLDAGPGRDTVYVSAVYWVDGARVRPRTVIDLAAGSASIPGHDVTFPFAGAELLMSYLPALTWSGTGGPDTVFADPAFDERTRGLIAYGRGGDDRIHGTTRADAIDGGSGIDRAHGNAGADDCISVEVQHSC